MDEHLNDKFRNSVGASMGQNTSADVDGISQPWPLLSIQSAGEPSPDMPHGLETGSDRTGAEPLKVLHFKGEPNPPAITVGYDCTYQMLVLALAMMNRLGCAAALVGPAGFRLLRSHLSMECHSIRLSSHKYAGSTPNSPAGNREVPHRVPGPGARLNGYAMMTTRSSSSNSVLRWLYAAYYS